MAINLGRLLCNEEIPEQYINDREIYVTVVTEPNVTKSMIGEVQYPNVPSMETSCREGRRAKGGGGACFSAS